jgi:hypothetical protein
MIRKSIVTGVFVLAALRAIAQEQLPLHLQRTIPLPSVSGKFDHYAIDTSKNLFFAAATGNHTVEVIDLKTGVVKQSITGLGKPHGLAWIPQTESLYVADGSLGELRAYKGTPLKLTGQLKLSDDADDMVYNASSGLLFVGHGGAGAESPARIAAVDTSRFAIATNTSVASHPEALDIDSSSGRIFANIADIGEVTVLDGDSAAITSHWKLERVSGNVPMAFDSEHQLLFIACRKPAVLIALDPATGKELFRLPTGIGADDMFYDPALHRIYVICGAGEIDTYQLDSRATAHAMATLHTAEGAKTGLFVPSQSLLYIGIPGVPTQNGSPAHSAGIRVYSTQSNGGKQ